MIKYADEIPSDLLKPLLEDALCQKSNFTKEVLKTASPFRIVENIENLEFATGYNCLAEIVSGQNMLVTPYRGLLRKNGLPIYRSLVIDDVITDAVMRSAFHLCYPDGVDLPD